MTTALNETVPLSAEARKEILSRRIMWNVAQGCRVEREEEFTAVLVRGRRPNHLLHLVLSVITFGIWLIVWGAISAFGGESRFSLSVDEYGKVISS